MADVAAVIVLVIVFILSGLYFLTRKKKSQSMEYLKDPVTGRKRLRIFEGHFERGKHEKLYFFGEAQLCNVVFIESTVPLKKSHLVTALVALANKHPYLRMKFEWEQNCRRYLTEMDQFTENELLYSEENQDDWIDSFEQDLQQVYNLVHGPLWRVLRIQDSFDSSTNKYTSTFLFSFHHAICDEMSVLSLLNQLLEILDQLHWDRFDRQDIPCLPILPSFLDLIKHHTHLSWWERIAKILNTKLQSLKGLQNYFLDVFPPPLVQNPSMLPTTHIIPGSLTEEQTALLVKNCKANNCTVTGALAVCLATALFKMAEQFDKNLEYINLGIPVNVRKGCKPVTNDEDIGMFVGIIFLRITKCEKSFWDESRKITHEVKQQLNDNKQFAITTSLANGLFSTVQFYEDSKRNMKYAGRYPNFELTNCGNFSLDKNRVHTVKKLHFAASQDVIGPIITLSSVTVNGQLNWTVIYSNAAIRKEHVGQISLCLNDSLIKLGCNK